jgi:hypothetical protein
MSDTFLWSQDVFNQTLKEYIKNSSRTTVSAINTKAYFVALGALRNTPVASKEDIKAIAGMGKFPARLVNWQRKRAGLKPLGPGPEMGDAIKKMIAAKLKSRSFLKAGWIPAIKILDASIEAKWRRGAPAKGFVQAVGQPKGSAKPAAGVGKVVAMIVNDVGATGPNAAQNSDALERYGGPALQKAFIQEVASMKTYLEQRMKPDADRFNAKQR